nr:hypothetical protein [Okeania sp. SIO2F4]
MKSYYSSSPPNNIYLQQLFDEDEDYDDEHDNDEDENVNESI